MAKKTSSSPSRTTRQRDAGTGRSTKKESHSKPSVKESEKSKKGTDHTGPRRK